MGMAAGMAADMAFGDPRRGHPVAVFGAAAAAAERRLYRDSRPSGAVFAAAGVVAAVVAGGLAGRAGTPGVAAVTFSAVGGTTLCRVGGRIADALDAGDLDGARAMLPSLVGRDPSLLDEAGICRAAVESIAENTSDATVAPLLWGAAAGASGLAGYRAVNTLDAMIGYRSPRYLRFGWGAARLDDAANLIPARVTAALAGVLSGHPIRAARAVHRDAGRHPSPNAGVVEAAFAGALGISLGGRTVYPHGVEDRPVLGEGRVPQAADLRAAVRLSRRVQVASAVLAVVVRAGVSGRSGGPAARRPRRRGWSRRPRR
ncbi:cobalamin biosynthesis protein [Gordonia iterans]|uniref:Cobalamin biosynthesis protein CobD n=1 Tax=Gordonia iterans TaxID=1004901 RepID=A0A2S0KKM9_9ACTN|nr:cobalamin biosynthesis protein [Gordonia iterans]